MLSSTAPGYWTAVGVIALYAVSSLFGVIGSITQNRKMIGVFKILYWLVTILLLIVTFALWILCLVKRDLLVESCAEVARELASSSSSYYTPVQLPNGGDNLTQSCATAAKQLLIVGGLIVFVGNLFQVYFASVISAYAARLKRNNQHQKLRDLDDYPEITANKMAVY
ncbi:uncharacterized protein BYT42DRAFT_574068 [Radiomyces spectabilis]|uniref:uncharacterized protein n=1 Tax=Radiomyces spectabilis TaxID=64574 RepID=UPI00221F64E6|nr:uncharacterized protein BYT42DRAFT_574068 [Radiomyces spectabilis]KAI8376280.1 hypothetical protein BYT42DRAFT_574068 [Radiomyces spectabilis]